MEEWRGKKSEKECSPNPNSAANAMRGIRRKMVRIVL